VDPGLRRDDGMSELGLYKKRAADEAALCICVSASDATAYVFICWKNSPLVFVDFSLSMRNSIASMVPIGFRIRRST
jgi:hypothetical protein